MIPKGEVDERSIREIEPSDLKGFVQCHFFAGVGGWSFALDLAGWPADRPVWTGSCPCQPFSSAGRRAGASDERHLWPVWYGLIQERRPSTVLGEQVESADGRPWLAGVRADLELLGYAVGAADLCAASVGAKHVRQRLWWVADADYGRCQGADVPVRQARQVEAETLALGNVARLSDPDGKRLKNAEGGAGPSASKGRTLARAVHAQPGARRWAPEPDVVRVVHGVSGCPPAVHALGNAIVPQVAAEFVSAYMESVR